MKWWVVSDMHGNSIVVYAKTAGEAFKLGRQRPGWKYGKLSAYSLGQE